MFASFAAFLLSCPTLILCLGSSISLLSSPGSPTYLLPLPAYLGTLIVLLSHSVPTLVFGSLAILLSLSMLDQITLNLAFIALKIFK